MRTEPADSRKGTENTGFRKKEYRKDRKRMAILEVEHLKKHIRPASEATGWKRYGTLISMWNRANL